MLYDSNKKILIILFYILDILPYFISLFLILKSEFKKIWDKKIIFHILYGKLEYLFLFFYSLNYNNKLTYIKILLFNI